MIGPPTHRDCFSQPLPQLTKGSGVRYRSVGASGATTNNATPPSILLNISAAYLENRAEKYLDEHKDNLRSKLPISTTFPSFTLDSENDVVTASYTYIILPIMEMLRIKYGDKITLRTELTEKAMIKVEKIVEDEVVVESVIRYDLVFKGSRSSAHAPRTVAVLEYKRRKMLRYTDFKEAIIPFNYKPADYNEAEYNLRRDGTLLMMNGISYSKQAAQYARTTNCGHVAIFDWENLVLLGFHELKQAGDFTAGKHALIAWIHESPLTNAGRFIQKKHIRKVMLGWILQALDQMGLS